MIPSGYKQTEIGVIPEDWQCIQFGEYIDVFRGGSPRPIENYLTTSEKGINWIKIGDVSKNEKYITKTEERITPQGADKSRKVYVGDFILSNSMSFGRPYILLIDGCIHDGWLVIQNYSTTFDKEYLYYLLSSQDVFRQYISMAAGSSVQNLNKEKVSALFVTLPPLPEQKRIAEALSDMDKLISSLEKLIAKKNAIKQGTMQDLLTGKRRLPGFNGEWGKFKFCDTNIQVIKGQIITKSDANRGVIPVIAGGKVPAYYTDRFNRNGKTITISASGASAGFVNMYDGAIFASDCSTISESEEYSIAFVYYLLLNLQNEIYSMQTGGAQPHIHPNDINSLNVFYINDIKEQIAIASVLSDMDNEIEQLEKDLSKYKKIKSGMMSELLTGRIRLV